MRAAETLAAAELALSAKRPRLWSRRAPKRGRLEGEKTEIDQRWRARSGSRRDRGGACQARGRERQRDRMLAGAECRACPAARSGRWDRGRASGRRGRAGGCAGAGSRVARRSFGRQARKPGARDRACHAPEAARARDAGAWTPIIEEIKVASGYEQALGAALGDDLDAASDEAAPAHWRLVGRRRLRPGAARRRHPARPIRQRAEACLRDGSRRSAWSRPAHGRALQARLKPGQRLVSKDGDLWRWDGYSVQAGTASAAGARLIERSRLER